MQVPVRAMVGGYPFSIEYKDSLDSEDGDATAGETVPYAHKIRISKVYHKSDERKLFATVLHELIHAALEVTGHSEGMKEHEEERLVYAIENMLAPLLCLNPNGPIKFKDIDMEVE